MGDCGCKSVCYDQEFPGLPPVGDCVFGEPRECGCKGECFHRAHPYLRQQRICRNAAYGKMEPMTGMEPMDAVSKYPDVMIPRITLRDPSDAILIIQALRSHQHARSDELSRAARRPGADQMALTLQHVNETQFVIDLMTAITDGIIPNDAPTEKKD